MAAPPPAKKQKTEKPKAPIVFKQAGLGAPDTCLVVFDQEYHVHSTLLKLYSAFFRKFMDSPDKANAITITPFKYYWVTVGERDGDWHLVALSKNLVQAKTANPIQTMQIWAFKDLLLAFYTQPYKIGSWQNLELMTKLADYYCCLPILSRTLSTALVESSSFIRSIKSAHYLILPIAARLRHALLFRECVIWLVGGWQEARSEVRRVEDLKLGRIVRNAFNKIAADVSQVQHEILHIMGSSTRNNEKLVAMIKETVVNSRKDVDDLRLVPLPMLFRSIDYLGLIDEEVGNMIGGLFLNRSALVHRNGEPGKGDLADYFLCASIPDNELPWDIEEVDW